MRQSVCHKVIDTGRHYENMTTMLYK